MSNLKALYKSSGEISKDLQQVQNKVIKNRLRWMDVESALASEDEVKDNTIIDGFKTVDKRVSAYPELDYGPSVASIYAKRSVKKHGGSLVSPQEIKTKAAKFANAGNGAKVVVKGNGIGTEWASYTATVMSSKAVLPITMDFTTRGGHLISYSDNREVGPAQVSMTHAMNKAETFLNQKGYPHMTAVRADRFDNLGNFTFITAKDGVLIYPEKITIRVGLDSGDVTGFQASDYENAHQDNRVIPKPGLSLAEVRKFLNPEFKELYNRLAWIENDDGQEVLTYEFGGKINGSQYRIYLNANDGHEETVEEIKTSSGAKG